MDKVLIVSMGVEGGGMHVYGCRTDGVWSFWSESSSMGLDENDEEMWRNSSSDPVPELSTALGNRWWRMHPIEIHPEFAAQLRQEYEQCRGASSEQERPRTHNRWENLFRTVENRPVESAFVTPRSFKREKFPISTYVAGTHYIEGLEKLEPKMEINDELDLFREPDNSYDPKAIVIKNSSGIKLGYIPRAHNAALSRLMDDGRLLFARIASKSLFGKWVDIEIKVYLHE
jgi:hypothetical protein